jgi:hypothetical protein
MNRPGWSVALVALLAGLAVPPPALAQEPAASFDDLPRWVRLGDPVTVTEASGRKVTGSIADLQARSLKLAIGKSVREFSQADVATITRTLPDPLGNGALIGAGIGAGFFLVAALSGGGCDWEGCGGMLLLGSVFYGAIGAGIGVGIDAMVPGRELAIYRRTAGHAAIGFSPRIGPTRQGVVVSVAF